MTRFVSQNCIGMKHMASAKRNSSVKGTSTRPSRASRKALFVVCIDNRGYEASLERNKIYLTVADADAESAGDVRIMDESGEDYLYSKTRFVQINVPATVKASIRKNAAA